MPSLWAFAYGYVSRDLPLPAAIEIVISKAVLLIVPGAFILIGMQLSKLQQWQNLRLGIFPAIFKMLILPGVNRNIIDLFWFTGRWSFGIGADVWDADSFRQHYFGRSLQFGSKHCCQQYFTEYSISAHRSYFVVDYFLAEIQSQAIALARSA